VTGMAQARCILGKFLRGGLPLISPAFRRFHFCRQVHPRPQTRETSYQSKVELWARMMSSNFVENFYIRKSTTWDGRLYFFEYFLPLKIRRIRPGLNREPGY